MVQVNGFIVVGAFSYNMQMIIAPSIHIVCLFSKLNLALILHKKKNSRNSIQESPVIKAGYEVV